MINRKIFFTSDLHFFHKNIIKYSNRPYLDSNGEPDVEAMNEGIIKNWNSVVDEYSEVYILGDVAMGGRGRANDLAKILSRLNGKKYLIPGNHDTYILESQECLNHLKVLPPIYELKVKSDYKKYEFVLCHYALRVWNKSGIGSYHLFGHSHGSLEGIGRSMDIGFDSKYTDHKPIHINDVIGILNKRTISVLDHHNEDVSYY